MHTTEQIANFWLALIDAAAEGDWEAPMFLATFEPFARDEIREAAH